MNVSEKASLKPFNTFAINVRCRFLVELLTEDDILTFFSTQGNYPKPFLFLGGGSNILFTKDFPGTVIRLSMKGIRVEREDDGSVVVRAASGENWDGFVKHCVDHGWGGLENLSMIPGNVGTGPIQNIGAYGAEIGDSILDVEVLETDSLKKSTLTNKECRFGYRDSIFKSSAKGRYFILSVRFRLSKNPVLNLDYGTIREELQVMRVNSPSIADVREAVCRIRTRKLPDPVKIGNAGSFFRNPVITEGHFQRLISEFPAMVHFPAENGRKIAAGWLIEQCGWKGKRFGDAGVHENQALVLVNYGNATGEEILALAKQIVDSVEEKFGIRLEPEVNIY